MHYVVETRGLGKAYRLYARPWDRIVEALSFGRVARHRDHWALRDVDLALRPGTTLGLCGGNGAGKSTLLKLLAGVTAPTEGRFRVEGRISSLLELGLGFQTELTGRANIVSKGMLLGMKRRELRALTDAIIDFAELDEFIDLPLRTYSSGMAMRLGFSVAISVEPDLLVLDEVFGVGDAAFQHKCIDRLLDLKRRNKTILFCTHSPIAMRQLCDEAIWIRDGRIHAIGDAISISGDYQTWMTTARDGPARIRESGFGTPEPVRSSSRPSPRIVAARVLDPASGQPPGRIRTHDSLEIRVEWSNPAYPEITVHVAVGFVRHDNVLCFGIGTHLDGHRMKGSHGETVLSLPELPLLEGEYMVIAWLLDETGLHRYEELPLRESLMVGATKNEIGLFSPPHSWSDA